jgi:hydroxymethylpyrimidine pyrophosphatase-like HAD family hydrolase
LQTFQVIASDYDSTLAHEGRVAPETLRVLRGARAAGTKLVLITGRTLRDLQTVFSNTSTFDLAIVENGALCFDPLAGLEEPLCAAPAAEFIAALSERRIPFSLGKRVVATHRPFEVEIQQIIHELKLNLAITLNRESVMILPRGVDKASGLRAALEKLHFAASDVVGIGDAENDAAFLRLCGFSVAVANAIDSLKAEVDYVTELPNGSGSSEIIGRVIARVALPQSKNHRVKRQSF